MRYEPALFERLMALDKRSLTAAMDGHLTPAETSTLLARRDLIVEQFCKLVVGR